MSCSISYAGMKQRGDRRGVPLPSYDGGVIVRPSAVEVACSYPRDTVTGGKPGGCQNAYGRWDLQRMLEDFQWNGQGYTDPGWFSG